MHLGCIEEAASTGSAAEAEPGGLLGLLELGDGGRTVHHVSDEVDLVSDLDLFQHGRVFDAEGHGHAGHAEVLQRAMLDGQHAGCRVDLLDLAIGHFGGCRHGFHVASGHLHGFGLCERSREDCQRGNQGESGFHVISFEFQIGGGVLAAQDRQGPRIAKAKRVSVQRHGVICGRKLRARWRSPNAGGVEGAYGEYEGGILRCRGYRRGK